MSERRLLVVGIVALVAIAGLAASLRDDADAASEFAGDRGSIVFVCRNGVAMSIWSARTFDRLAAERGLEVRAVSRAAAPTFTRVPLRMKLALWLDGLRLGGYRPQVISAADVRGAQRVIVIDTELPPAASVPGTVIETWAGFPPMREKYYESRAALQSRVELLVERLASAPNEGES